MGNFSCPVEVFSEDGSRSITIDALVDTGATYTCLPEARLRDLGITPSRRVESVLADGSVIEDDVGVTSVRVQGVPVITYVVFAEESAPALLGAYTLEGALLAVDPVAMRLVPTRNLRVSRF